jgi:DNA-binding transcriptional regulator GbsR (MarR family)
MSNKKDRATIITSISLSPEFKDICEKWNISPTNAVRKGIAIELYCKGVEKYQSETNRERMQGIKDLLQEFEDIEKLKTQLKEKAKPLMDLIKKLNKALDL